jgi:riboflavin kinase
MHSVSVILKPAPVEGIDMATTAESAVGHDEIAVLKLLALEGALEGEVKTSCRDLADRLDASNQTASRRLRRLEGADYLERETVSDGQWIAITDAGERALRGEYEDYRRVFETGVGVELTGHVTTGMGEGRHYITLEGYMEQFVEKLGYEPFPGTLNVDLTEASIRRRSALSSQDAVYIEGWEDDDRTYGPAHCYPATVSADGDSYEGVHVIVPERTHHDEDQVELIAPDKLRDELGLDDEDRIRVRTGDQA